MLERLPALLAQAEPSGFVVWVDRLARAPLSVVVVAAAVVTMLRLAAWPILTNTHPDDRFGLYNFARLVNEVCDAVVYAGVVIFMLVRPFGIQTFYIPTGSMIDTLLLNDYVVANKMAFRVSDPKRGEIVVFRPPPRALQPGQEETDYIKRLIGLPGDVVEWRQKELYINGKHVPEPYVDYTFPGNPGGNVMPKKYWNDIRMADFKLVLDVDRCIPVQYTENAVNQMASNGTGGDESLTQCADEYIPRDPEEARRWRDLPPAAIPPRHYLFMGDNRNGSSDGRSWGLVPRENIIGKSEFIWFPLNRLRKTE